jgi:hypothetical protein
MNLSAFRVRLLLAVPALFLLASLSACGKSKVEQCNALVDAANKDLAGAARLDASKPASLQSAVTALEESNKRVGEVKLSDEKLIELRGKFVKTHSDAAAKLKTFVDVAKRGEALDKDTNADAAAVAAFNKEIDGVNRDTEAMDKASSQVIDDLNAYCSK